MKLNLFYERESSGWSQAFVVQYLGISQSYYCMIENGKKKNPSLQVLKRLEELFGHSHEYLLSPRS